MGDRKLETVAKEVFLSIPPDVRTGVFIDVFTPCDWHHAAQCMVDYAGILDDPREPFAPACDMPVICTTTVTEKTVVSDVRPLVGLPDDAYDDIVAGEMDYVGVRSGTDELGTRIVRIWGLESIDCDGNLPQRRLPSSDIECTVYRNDRRVHVTIHADDSNRLGLYDTDGKALKPVGKD